MASPHLAAIIVTVLTSLLALGWLRQAIGAFRGVPTLPDLTQLILPVTLPDSTEAPDLTVVVPACNEEQSIQATLRSLLASTGIRLQIVVIDDRSTDNTGALIDEVADQAAATPGTHQLIVIHNRQLPAGWLGKPHALSLGAARAAAPWLLFTDGDLTFDPRALALAVHYATKEKADHVVLALTLEFKSIAEAAVFAAFEALAQWSMRLWKVADPNARDFFGAGGFNLVRRQVFDRLGGFSTLQMEVVEDLRLGWKIKRAGYVQRAVLGPNLARIRWIQGAFGIIGLLEKNGFAGLRYSTVLALVATIGFSSQILLPLVALFLGRWSACAGILTYAFIALTYLASRRITRVSAWNALLFAPASTVLLVALLRSTLLTLIRGGVVWRGTLYPLTELRRQAGPGWHSDDTAPVDAALPDTTSRPGSAGPGRS